MKNTTAYVAFKCYLNCVRKLAYLEVAKIKGQDVGIDDRCEIVTRMHKAINILHRLNVKCPPYNRHISEDISDILANRI